MALTYTDYLVRMMRSRTPKDKAAIAKVDWIWPNQSSSGVHVNISGRGVTKNAPNREAAIKFREYLVSDQAQSYLANGNNE